MIFTKMLYGASPHITSLANVWDCDIVGGEFKSQLLYYIHFQTNALGKGLNAHIPPALL